MHYSMNTLLQSTKAFARPNALALLLIPLATFQILHPLKTMIHGTKMELLLLSKIAHKMQKILHIFGRDLMIPGLGLLRPPFLPIWLFSKPNLAALGGVPPQPNICLLTSIGNLF
jgi:hypothetical protein